ncbi:MAG: c-type cytochrome [Cytophagaceae bacterium]|nr:c-type cytochrome [Cytophagaceae bacterium]
MKTKNIFKKYLLLILMILSGSVVHAADETTAGVINSEKIVLWFCLATIILILLVIAYIFYAMSVFIKHSGLNIDIKIWEKLRHSLTKEVPVEKEEHILLHHEYDGIRELDNSMPPWWVYMFYATIVFSVVYLFHYHISSDGQLQDAEYQAELREAEELKSKLKFVDENTVFPLTDASRIKNGEVIFLQNCSTCHGKNAEGKVGPNLKDNQWIHGGELKNIFKTIKTGTTKGMPPWESQLSPTQIQEVASYILSLKNSNAKKEAGPVSELNNKE